MWLDWTQFALSGVVAALVTLQIAVEKHNNRRLDNLSARLRAVEAELATFKEPGVSSIILSKTAG